jgi:hypothetical protein
LWEPHLGPMRIYQTVSERLSEKGVLGSDWLL